MTKDLPGVGTGVGPGQAVQHGQPDVVAHHDDQDDDEEHRQLPGDGAFIGQACEGAGDEERKDGDDHAGHDIQHDALELLQDPGDGLGLGPGGGQAHQHGEHQGGHHRHDRSDLQVEQQLREMVETLRRRLDG